ncbi:MAG: hypothetical protein WD512_04290 [Candidatus Paceibacterota bacterium]
MGSGCPVCAEEKRVSGYSRSDFIRNANGRTCVFYVIRCWNENEDFYKVGISMRSIKKRYGSKKRMPYNYSIKYEFKSKDVGLIYNLEKKYLKKYKSLSKRPLIDFNGVSECFTTDLPVDEIKEYLKNKSKISLSTPNILLTLKKN